MESMPPTAASAEFHRRLFSVTWPLIVIAALMLFLCIASLTTLSSIRAFVNGEGMWSKAERQAIAELREFGSTGSPVSYARFRIELAVPLGDHAARLQLQGPAPDYQLAARGFIAGRNHPDDVPGMMRLFRVFRNSAIMARPIAAWTQGDQLILQLDQVGQEMHAAIAAGETAHGRVEGLVANAEMIHLRVAPLEDDFSSSLGSTSRQVRNLLSAFLALCTAVLVGIGTTLSRNTIRRSERIAKVLRETQEQAYLAQAQSHVTLESIADAVLCTNYAQQVTYLNSAAEQLTGWSAAEATGQPLATVLHILPESNAHSVTTEIERIVAGEQRTGAATGSLLQRRDGVTIAIHERAAPIRDSHDQVTGIVFVMRDITQQRELAAQLQHQATHDALTGLTNRREFERLLRRAIDDQAQVGVEYALLYLDLDQFKVINDTCGHAAGDQLICQVSWVIDQKIRSGDVLARLGGDEFGVLLTSCPQRAALSVAESIRRSISDLRFTWEGRVFQVNASIGVLALAEALPTVDDALSAADQACYLAKDNGRNRVQCYRADDQEMRARHGEMQWVERLNTALELNRFALFAQEICPVASSPTISSGPGPPRFEILLRLIDVDGSLIAPMAFIPAAERYGLMPRIDRWVIANACQKIAEMRARYGTIPTCLINLSGASVTDTGIADFVSSQLARSKLPRGSIGFEVTETAAIGNLASAAQLMNQLRDLDCPIALDDFGSGMSSFGYLRNLPVNYLKIDGEFVKDMTTDPVDYAVVESIHKIGRVMGIKTVAESVDSEATLAALMLVGVDYAQGFHLGSPIPILEIMNKSSPGAALTAATLDAHRALRAGAGS
jgi:diguanylate cyclase (GGDEF)-like protein/PAS domain S-box-containing protein